MTTGIFIWKVTTLLQLGVRFHFFFQSWFPGWFLQGNYRQIWQWFKVHHTRCTRFLGPLRQVCMEDCVINKNGTKLSYLLDLCRRGTIIFWLKIKDKTLQILPQCGFIRGCTTILFYTCHYGLLHNIIAYKQLQYIATYFSSKDFALTRQL